MTTLTQKNTVPASDSGGKKWLSFLADYSTIIFFVLMLAVAGILSDKFFTIANITNVLRQSAPLGIIALGMLFVILTGGIDLSVGSMMALVSVVVALLMPNFGLLLSLFAGVSIATIIGSISGGLVSYFRIAPFIATLAMMTIARGIAQIVTKGQPVFIDHAGFKSFGEGYFLGLPLPVYVFIAFAILAHIIYKKTTFGRLVISIGSNETATRFAGIRVERYKFAVYALSGLACGIGGIIATSRTGVGSPVMSESFELDAIAAVVVGGASLAGGRGNVFNTVIGVLILGVISNLMNLMKISGNYQQVVKGLIIILAVLLESLKSKK
ncbi:ABC transporter permease [Thorsellia anophelis]|uniref:Monosaccharide ABC transporter membrane protein, CUT2 family (TC 3.A.1.2.-) n=1 Tax=Thorsellia anophelis DSM 18579 TaxID=1123402 RepID=A0A1I0F6J3_9GAMM|nr:monosaccharide ABC transporter membrane protein, CUT2 family (TC 3.A.1.2.-) [Thorsellia anophelis DSM 18579]